MAWRPGAKQRVGETNEQGLRPHPSSHRRSLMLPSLHVASLDLTRCFSCGGMRGIPMLIFAQRDPFWQYEFDTSLIALSDGANWDPKRAEPILPTTCHCQVTTIGSPPLQRPRLSFAANICLPSLRQLKNHGLRRLRFLRLMWVTKAVGCPLKSRRTCCLFIKCGLLRWLWKGGRGFFAIILLGNTLGDAPNHNPASRIEAGASLPVPAWRCVGDPRRKETNGRMERSPHLLGAELRHTAAPRPKRRQPPC